MCLKARPGTTKILSLVIYHKWCLKSVCPNPLQRTHVTFEILRMLKTRGSQHDATRLKHNRNVRQQAAWGKASGFPAGLRKGVYGKEEEMEAMLQGKEWKSTTTTICLRHWVPKYGCIFLLPQSISKSLRLRPDPLNCCMLVPLRVTLNFYHIISLFVRFFFPPNNSFKRTILITAANLF